MTKKLHKNRLFVAMALTLLVALAPMQSIAQKKVAYLTKPKLPTGTQMDPTASPTNNDAIIRMFKNENDPRFTISVIEDDGTGSSAVNLSNYDLLIIQETFGSGDAVLKPAGILGISKLTIPVIYNKVFALRGTRALTTSAATAADVTDLSITVPPANQSNPLFTGITFVADAIKIFNAGANDFGAAGTKGLQYATGIELSTTGTCKGFVTGISSADTSISINDIPGGTTFGSSNELLPASSRMITFAWNYGAIAAGDGTNMTADALKLWKNAALILTGQPLLGTNENTLALDNVSVSPNPTTGLVTVNSASSVKAITVYDAAGKQVSASKTNTVDLSNQAKGIYLVQVQTENGSTTKKVVVE